jgi:hypothetical protein
MMRLPISTERLTRAAAAQLVAALTSLAVAAALLSRFGINGKLGRDQSIYAYGGQQMAHGTPPYASIFDPKTPLATMIAGLAAEFARLVGGNDIYWIRGFFFGCAVLVVLAVYLLAQQIWNSVPAGIVAAIVFSSFNGFAMDSLAGPDAKTPGVLAVVLSMWFLVHRRWFLAALAGSIGTLAWQPFVIYPVVVAVFAVVDTATGLRRKTLGRVGAGAVIPLLVVGGYFLLTGALGDFIQAAFVFPATGVERPPETFGQHFTRIATVIHASYGVSGVLLWIGMAVIVALAIVPLVRRRDGGSRAMAHPLSLVVVITMLGMLGYAVFDFQGAADVFPLLPYGALGMGAAAAVVLKLPAPAWARGVPTVAALIGVAVLAAFSWSWFSHQLPNIETLRSQQADGCAVDRLLGHGGNLDALGDPAPLVITHRRNPDRFIYLGSGVDRWKIHHTAGRFNGWVHQIEASSDSVITIGRWDSDLRLAIRDRLVEDGYQPGYLGSWRVFLTPATLASAQAADVQVSQQPTPFATGLNGQELPAGGCG